jgi:chromatin structure-remodeling complex protein RSC7
MGGIYDIHTNSMQYPEVMQPTHCRVERVPPPDNRSLMTDMSSLSIANQNPDTNPSTPSEPTDSTNEPTTQDNKPEQQQASVFPPVPAHISNRYVVQDIIFESPPYSNMGVPGPDGDLRNLQPNGLVSIANPAHPEFMSPEIIALLPDNCKEALLESATREVEWKMKWTTEATDTQRAVPSKSYAWYP